MLHDKLPFFWADISVYPGNSGGPVVANDRLVGVVMAQEKIPIDNSSDVEKAPDGYVRIPFGRIIKTRYVRPLIEEQEQKDCIWANPMSRRK